MSKILTKIFLISIIYLLTIQVSIGQSNGFISKSSKISSSGFKNKWADAKIDSLASDSSIHLFGSYNFRDDKNIPYLAKRQIHKGDLYFNLGPGKYDKAMYHYKKAFTIDPNIAYLDFKIGQCYLLMRHNKSRSILYLEKAFHQNKRVSKEIHYYLGRSHQINTDYPRAIIEYEKSISEYRKAHRNDHISLAEKHEHQELIAKQIDECKFAVLLKEDPKKVLIENVGDSINSEYSEYNPFISADESIMMFTSRRKGTRGGGKAEVDHVFYEDIYLSYNKNGLWSEAKQMKNNFNKKTNDAIIGLSHDGKEIFLYRDTKHGDIYLANREDDTWTRPMPIKEINTGYQESSACFSFDKQTIYFVSDKPGGYGGRDIYYSNKKDDGTWGIPLNLGRTINTKYDEERLYIHPNGKTIFFSSKGHNSMGGYDIFLSELDENGEWGKPENLGYPINGPDDEISFVITAEGNRGYYSSYRPGGKGDRDIYLIRFGISSKIGIFNREDDLLSKKKLMKKEEFMAEVNKIGITPIGLEDVSPILPNETMTNIHDMADLWDAEIAELLALLENATDPQEIKDLERRVRVKREELILLNLAVNLADYPTFDKHVKLREYEIYALQLQLDSTNKKKNIRNLQAQINVKRNEVELLQSAYIRDEQNLEDDKIDQLNLNQTIAVTENDSVENNLFINQNNSADSLSVTNNIELNENVLEQQPPFSENDDIDSETNNTTDKESILVANGNSETSTENSQTSEDVLKLENNLLINQNSSSDSVSATNNIELAENENTLEQQISVTENEINQSENQVTNVQNETNNEDSVSEAINTTENEPAILANGTTETNIDNSQTSKDVQTLEQGSSMILENVLFDYDKSTLRPESYETLDKLVKMMKQPPAKSKVEISGHTDSKGSNDYNQKLAERRAQAVVDYIINKGISENRLVAKGYGESRPKAPNSYPDGSDNPAGRQLNRRTELKLLKE